jgi:hypothetical protein
LNETSDKLAKECQNDLKNVSDALKTQLQELNDSIASLGSQTRSDLIQH